MTIVISVRIPPNQGEKMMLSERDDWSPEWGGGGNCFIAEMKLSMNSIYCLPLLKHTNRVNMAEVVFKQQ